MTVLQIVDCILTDGLPLVRIGYLHLIATAKCRSWIAQRGAAKGAVTKATSLPALILVS